MIAGLWSIASVAEAKDTLFGDQMLRKGEQLTSANDVYRLVCQEDGNLVLYVKGGSRALWASGTDGKAITGCIMQSDGNLVLYAYSGKALWATGTHGHPGAYLIMQNDGNAVIYSLERKPLWATGTSR
jgi:hypothetical protein